MRKFLYSLAAMAISFSLFRIEANAQTMAGLREQNTMSVLWFQKSAEAKALYYQGYNIGKMRLDEILSKWPKNKGLKPAIVLDIDETILDNSPYQAWLILSEKGNPLDWNDWFSRANAKPLPGALHFLHYADSMGVEIFYISNRNERQKDATIKNLQAVGAPQADSEHVLLQQGRENSKEVRRAKVAKTYDIILLFGDNLGDFSGFDGLSAAGRQQAAEKHKEEFGRKLIVFPNPMYGDWEGAIYNYDFTDLSTERIDKLRKAALNPYIP